MKKGISPLIAAVLLVGFTIAMAAFVTNFLIQKTEESFQPETIIGSSEYCDFVSLGYTVNGLTVTNFTAVGNVKNVSGIQVTNKGSFTIWKLTIQNPGADETEGNIPLGVKPKGVLDFMILFDPVSTERYVKITPWIRDPKTNETVICIDSDLVFNLEDACGTACY